MLPVVTVIVPVFNVEAYLDRCVASIVAQDYDPLEIVLIDDGATDSSGALCDRWAAVDKRVRVIHQVNGGLADARNMGLDLANGEFVCFVDSDDYLRSDHVSSLLGAVKTTGADLVVGGFRRTTGTLEGAPDVIASVITLVPREALRLFVGAQAMSMTVAWAKLSRRSLWDGLRFPVGRVHEDEYVSHVLVERASLVAFVPSTTYYYFVRPGSITGTPLDAKRYFDLWDALWSKGQRFHELGLMDEAREIRRSMLRRAMRSRRQLSAEDPQEMLRWTRETRRCAATVLSGDRGIAVRAFALLAAVSPRLAGFVYEHARTKPPSGSHTGER